MTDHRPHREIRAVFDDSTITVYQAYSPVIGVPASARGSFVGTPYKFDRMTWIKPSFLWMMYRSGWATKPGQEHVLAITMKRSGFEEALSRACVTPFEPDIHNDWDSWSEQVRATEVRVQWDPERDLKLERRPWRAIQIGLSGGASKQFAQDWVVGIADVTQAVREIRNLIASDDFTGATAMLPAERPYPLPESLKRVIGVA